MELPLFFVRRAPRRRRGRGEGFAKSSNVVNFRKSYNLFSRKSDRRLLKNYARAGKKEGGWGEGIFARPPQFPAEFLPAACGGGHWLFSGIFDKMSSSEVINILHNLTFRNFSDFFVGGAERRPLIFWLAAQSAARQTEVRAKDFFGSSLFL